MSSPQMTPNSNAAARAQALGFPHRKTESYRYLNLKRLRETVWIDAAPVNSAQMARLRAIIRENAIPGRELLVFCNGQWVRELSMTGSVDVQELDPSAWESAVSAVPASTYVADYFDEMNESRSARATHIRIKASARVQLLFVSDVEPGAPVRSASRTLTEISGDADVFEQHVQGADSRVSESWAQAEIRVVVDPQSRVDWTQWQGLGPSQEILQRTRFVVGGGAHLRALHIAAGARLSRQNVDFHVTGAGADVTLNGITLVGPGQTADFHTLVDHIAGGSSTRQLYKGILGSDAQAVFNGRVVIHKGAQKASSEQLNQNLLLSDRSEIDSKPELEIFADDVKATHGSAIGQLNDDEVFYLRSRGIAKGVAEEMIALGSVVGLVDEIKDADLKSRLTDSLGRAYRGLNA